MTLYNKTSIPYVDIEQGREYKYGIQHDRGVSGVNTTSTQPMIIEHDAPNYSCPSIAQVVCD